MHAPRLSPARRAVLAGGTAILLGAAAVGAAGAQQAPTPTPSPTAPAQGAPARPGPQAFLDALARRLGITTDRLQQALNETRTELGATDDGHGPGGIFGPGGPGRGGRGSGERGFGGVDSAVVAQALGITQDQLRQDLPGKSLAQVAQARGKNPADVATALKNAANQRIDQAVTAGRLTADQAAQQKQQVAQRIDQLMNQVLPQPGTGPRGSHQDSPTPSSTPTTRQGA